MNNDFCRILFWLIAAIGIVSVEPAVAVPLTTLEDTIPHIELTQSAEAIGGATIEDAVVALRQLTSFPICIEILEYDQQKDGLTLAKALEQLRTLKAKGELTDSDHARLERYQVLAASESPSILIGYTKKTFMLVESKITIRALLNRITELDSTYTWRNDGTDKEPIIVLQPRVKTALDWSIPSVCDSSRSMSTKNLFAPGGKLTLFFQAYNIHRLEMNSAYQLPDVQIDLCHDHLSARDVLNLVVKAAGHDLSWSLSGIKGLRWLTFQQN